MKNVYKVLLSAFLIGGAISSSAYANSYIHIAVANRNSSSISLVGLHAEQPENFLADGGYGARSVGFDFEPLYVSKFGDSGVDFVGVGDRKNSQVLIFHKMGGGLFKKIPVGKGVIHQAADRRKLYVATDIEKGFNVLEYHYNGTVTNRRFDLPAEYSGGKPHDIIATRDNVYLTVQGIGQGDVVLQIDPKTLTIKKERQFSADVHLLGLYSRFALVEQETGLIRIIDDASFRDVSVTRGPVGAHGVSYDAYRDPNDRSRTIARLYVTDIDQKDGRNSILIYEFNDDGKLSLLATGNTPKGTAHNITTLGKYIFVTHSGEQSSEVSVLRLNPDNQIEYIKPIFTGANPFGITTLAF